MGEEQAEELALKLEGCTIHAAVSSPLIRARKTAEIIARPHGIEIITDERLVEQDYGIYEGGLRTAPEFAAAKNQFAKRLQNGESNLQVAQRVFNAMDDISKRYPNQSVLVVGHAAICKMIAAT
jgi:probable phosphoglycerate mutase